MRRDPGSRSSRAARPSSIPWPTGASPTLPRCPTRRRPTATPGPTRPFPPTERLPANGRRANGRLGCRGAAHVASSRHRTDTGADRWRGISRPNPEFQAKLDWAQEFVKNEIIPIEGISDLLDYKTLRAIMKPLQEEVKRRTCGPPTSSPSSAAAAGARSSWPAPRDPRQCRFAPAVVRQQRAGLGQRRAHRPRLAQPGPEGPVAVPASRGQAPQLLLDDRARRRCRPDAAQDPRRARR